MSELPVVVIGAGPLGLAAAAHLLERGLTPLVLEAGPGPGCGGRAMGARPHLLPVARTGRPRGRPAARTAPAWRPPTIGFPTGREWIDDYLAPVADALGERVQYGARVQAVSRLGRDRLVSPGRAETPFVVHVTDADGAERRVQARAVIDASGTWGQPNPAGADGVSAIGERAAAVAGVADLRPADARAGLRPGGQARGGGRQRAFGDDRGDPARRGGRARSVDDGDVGAAPRRHRGTPSAAARPTNCPSAARWVCDRKESVEAGWVSLLTGIPHRARRPGGRPGRGDRRGRAVSLPPADHVVVLTGFRPDLSFLSEMRIELDPILQAPVRLAPSIDPNAHSCGSVSAARRSRIGASRTGSVHRGHEVLRPCADVPGDDRLRAGPQHRRRIGRRPRGRTAGSS